MPRRRKSQTQGYPTAQAAVEAMQFMQRPQPEPEQVRETDDRGLRIRDLPRNLSYRERVASVFDQVFAPATTGTLRVHDVPQAPPGQESIETRVRLFMNQELPKQPKEPHIPTVRLVDDLMSLVGRLRNQVAKLSEAGNGKKKKKTLYGSRGL